nr:hypothetical protein ISGA_06835 [Gordonia sp. NB41Y]
MRSVATRRVEISVGWVVEVAASEVVGPLTLAAEISTRVLAMLGPGSIIVEGAAQSVTPGG